MPLTTGQPIKQAPEPTKIITRFVETKEKFVQLGTRIWNADPRQALTLTLVYVLVPASFVLQLLGRGGFGWYGLCSVITVCYFVEHWGKKPRKKK